MTTVTINGTDTSANTITVTNALVGPGFAYILNLIPGVGLADSLVINGAGSNDKINLSLLTALSGLTEVEAYGGGGADTIWGSTTHDDLFGGTGVDTLYGGFGNDTLQGDAGADAMYGGHGNDVFLISAGDGEGDTFTGGSGFDVIRIIPGQTASFANVSATNFISIEQIDGSDAAITGTLGADVLDFSALKSAVGVTAFNGGSGDDYIRSVANTAVRLEGGDGQDTLFGNDLGEEMHGGTGNDVIHGNAGDDAVYGGAGADSLYGGASKDTLDGGADADMLFGGDGEDIFNWFGSEGQGEIFNGGAGADTIRQTDLGQPLIILNVGDENFINVERFNFFGSSVNGTNAANLLDFSAITRAIEFGTINGLGGDDTIRGFETTAIELYGGTGNDEITGNGQNETLSGDADNDLLFGADGDDLLLGGTGNDTLLGGAGADTLTGGDGADRFVFSLAPFSSQSALDVITDFEGAGVGRIDVISLEQIDANNIINGDQDFVFNSAGIGGISFAFDGTDTLVQLNTDGDAEFEMVIRLVDGNVLHTTYVMSDFAL